MIYHYKIRFIEAGRYNAKVLGYKQYHSINVYIVIKMYIFFVSELQSISKEKQLNEWITVYEGKTKGRLIGGNLNTIMGIWGSEYMPEIKKGDILLLEDSLKDAATLERSFSFLKINKVFEKISGILLGKHELFNDLNTGKKPYDILLEILGDTKIPFLADFDCCHTHPMITLPIGCEIELDATNKKITILN